MSVISDISKGSPVQRLGQGQPSPVSVLDVHSLEFTKIGPKSQGKKTCSHSISLCVYEEANAILSADDSLENTVYSAECYCLIRIILLV